MTAVVFSAMLRAALAPPPSLVIVGASLTEVTVMVATSDVELNAVVPPLTDVLTLLPAEPDVWSQARKPILADVPVSPFGVNRTRSISRRSNEDALDTAPNELQFEPALIEYSQDPFPLGALKMAIPSWAPVSISVIRSPPALAMIWATVFPELLMSSSVIVVSDDDPLKSSTGASLTAVTSRVIVL